MCARGVIPWCRLSAEARVHVRPVLASAGYFWHVANVKCDLLHDWRTANGARRAAALEDEATLALEPEAGEADAAGGSAQAESVAVDDLDAEFERLVSSPIV